MRSTTFEIVLMFAYCCGVPAVAQQSPAGLTNPEAQKTFRK